MSERAEKVIMALMRAVKAEAERDRGIEALDGEASHYCGGHCSMCRAAEELEEWKKEAALQLKLLVEGK